MVPLHRTSGYLIFTGVLAIVFGLIASFSPIGSILTLVILWGAYALVDGIFAIVAAFRPESAGARAWLLLIGIVGVLAGIVAMTQPISSAVTLTWILGIWLIVRGIFELGSAIFGHASGSRLLLALAGIFWIVGGVIIAGHPGQALVGISLWIGIMAIIWGVFLLVTGIMMRRDSTTKV